MNSFNRSFVAEFIKLAEIPMMEQRAAEQAAAARAAASSRNKKLFGLGLLGGGAAAAHHFGLDAGIMEKLKGLFGSKAQVAAEPTQVAAEPIHAYPSPIGPEEAPIEAYSSPIGPELPKPISLDKYVNLAKQKMNAGIDAVKAGKEYGEVSKAFGIPALDVEGGPNQYGSMEGNKNFLYDKVTGKMLYDEPGMVASKERIITSPGGDRFVVPNRPYAGLPAADQFRALQNHMGIPIGADGSVNPAVLAKMSPEAKEALLKNIKEIKTIGDYQNMPIRPSAITPPDLSPSKFGPKYTPAGIGPRIGIN